MNEATVRGSERGPPQQERLSNGDLLSIWSGPGSGQLCSGCSKAIGFEEVELEVELPAKLTSSVLRFHAECYRIWSGERDAPGKA
jgi:hypothetical protein